MQSSRELEWSFIGVLIIAVGYILYEALGTPGGGDPIGHMMGIVGMTMMLMTETLYTFRKRVRWFQVGRLRAWLSFHIFTGVVGPALVLTHTAFEFNGLAGLSMFLTVIVVGSGFVGRYLYTAIPRTRAGAEMSLAQVTGQEAEIQVEIDRFQAGRDGLQCFFPADAFELALPLLAHAAQRMQQPVRMVGAFREARHLGAQHASRGRVVRIALDGGGHAIGHGDQQGAGIRAVERAGGAHLGGGHGAIQKRWGKAIL